MTAEARQAPLAPHLVMVVGNSVTGDSRVEKAAASAVEAGYRVTVVGVVTRAVHGVELLGTVPLIRVRPTYARYTRWQMTHGLGPFDPSPTLAAAREARRLRAELVRPSRGPGLGAAVRRRAGRAVERAGLGPDREPLADRLTRWRHGAGLAGRDALARVPAPGVWRAAFPLLADLEDAFLEVLLPLEPDLVHVHDRHAMSAAVELARLSAARGRRVPWVYDAHEWLPGQEFAGPAAHGTAWRRAEREFAGRADAVVTVGEDLARMLRLRHHLDLEPVVVTNAPVAGPPTPAAGRRTVREECGVGPDAPVLVYSGRLATRRGVGTAVRALPALPGVHLAVVASQGAVARRELTDEAERLGVADRVHVLEYVPASSITWFMSTATVGLSPLAHNSAHHSAVPTKVREYLHAGLPVVGSDVRAQARLISSSGVGEVHEAGSPSSFATAVRAVLDDLPRYRAALTPELLAEHSWQEQEKVLRAVWAGLVPPVPRAPVATPGGSRTVVGPLTSSPDTQSLVRALRGAMPEDDLTLLTHEPALAGPGVRLSRAQGSDALSAAAVEDLRDLVAGHGTFLLVGLSRLVPGLFATTGDEVSALRRAGREVAVLVEETDVVDLADLAAHGVHNSWEHSDSARAERWARRVRRNRRALSRLDVPVLVLGTGAHLDLPTAVAVPVPLEVVEPTGRPSSRPTVTVLPGRSQSVTAIRRTVADSAAEGIVREPGGVGADVVLVPGREVRGPDVLRAVATGALVLAVHEDEPVPGGPPVEVVRPDLLGARLASVAVDPASLLEDGHEARAWVRQHHSRTASVDVVTGTLRLAGLPALS